MGTASNPGPAAWVLLSSRAILHGSLETEQPAFRVCTSLAWSKVRVGCVGGCAATVSRVSIRVAMARVSTRVAMATAPGYGHCLQLTLLTPRDARGRKDNWFS